MIQIEDLPNPLPRNWEIDVYLVLTNFEFSGMHIRTVMYEPSKGGDSQLLAKAKVTFEVGDIDIPGIQIEALKKEKQKIIADAHVAAEFIDQQIQSLLAIEYQPDTDGAA